MHSYILKTYGGESYTLQSLSLEETNDFLSNKIEVVREYSETKKAYRLSDNKILAVMFFDNSGILFPSKDIYEDLESRTVFLKLGDNKKLVGFQMLSAEDLPIVDKLIKSTIGTYCEGESFELTNGLIYTKEKYRRHGYIFMSKEELQFYCTQWVDKLKQIE